MGWMKILVDENIPLMTVRALRTLGQDVLDVRGTSDEGSIDRALWQKAQQEGYLLITTDKGFTEHRNEQHHGILIVRLRQPNRQRIHQRVMQAVGQYKPEEWEGLLVVIRDTIQSVWRSTEIK